MQEIIVYRNPVEAAFWGSFNNGTGSLFPIIVAMAVALITILVCCRIVDRYVPRNKQKVWTNVSLVVGAVSAAIVLYVM